MGQEFFINSTRLEDQIRSLLPSQGGAGAGFDLSASTQIIPIVDLTESAEGSNLRSDLQQALSFASNTSFAITNGSSDLVTNTGYFRIFGTAQGFLNSGDLSIKITDGASTKILWNATYNSSASGAYYTKDFDFIVFMTAGDTLSGTAASTSQHLLVTTRQIATIDNVLVNPN